MGLKVKAKGAYDLIRGETLRNARVRGQALQRKVDNPWFIGQKTVRKMDDVPKGAKAKELGKNQIAVDDRSTFQKLKDLRKNKKDLAEMEGTAKNIEKSTRMAQAAVATPVAVGAGVGAKEIYDSKKKDQKIVKQKAKQIYRAGESNVVRGMLQDPRFPLGAKLRILEGEGVIKTSSLWSAIKGTNYKAAKGQMDSLGKRLTETSKKLEEASGGAKQKARKTNKDAEKAWEEARGKVWKEGFKTWSARIGLGGAAATPFAAKKIKEASFSPAKIIATTTLSGTAAGGIATALNPKLPDNGPTAKEIAEGAAFGGTVGLGAGLTAVGGQYLKDSGKVKNLVKKGALDVSDIEKRLGGNYNLGEDKEKFVRRSIGQHQSDSFILKHPYLTGIPTLGLAPALKEHAIKDKIISQLAKDSMKNEGDVYRLYIN